MVRWLQDQAIDAFYIGFHRCHAADKIHEIEKQKGV